MKIVAVVVIVVFKKKKEEKKIIAQKKTIKLKLLKYWLKGIKKIKKN